MLQQVESSCGRSEMPSKSHRAKLSTPKVPSSASKSKFSAKTFAGVADAGSRCSTPVSNASSTPQTARTSSRIRTKKLLKSARKKEDSDSEKDYGDEYKSNSDTEPEDSTEEQEEEHMDSDGLGELEPDEDSWADTPSIGRGKLLFRRSPTPEILDEDEIPTLELPDSSNDLCLAAKPAFEALGIYEILRHFRVLLRLSPFRFEDFCCALVVDENSPLIAQIHICLLKSLIREEESNQTFFGPQDSKDSVNILFHFLDTMTWYECIRLYLSSDKSNEFKSATPALSKADYFSTNINERLQILRTLTDQYLSSNAVREELLKEGQFIHEDHCRNCHRQVYLEKL